MKALIDGDIIAYEFGNAKDPRGSILSWPFVVSRVNSRLDGIMEATGADSYDIFLTKEKGTNFRTECATILPYKGNRPSDKSHWWKDIRTYLIKVKGAIEVDEYEADDEMSIRQMEAGANDSTIICTRDKDLNMVPGWHYSWGSGNSKEKLPWFQDELGGWKCFFKQCLTGDSTDNILGIFGLGQKSSLLKRVDSCDSPEQMYEIVRKRYYQQFGNYWKDFLWENASLLWMLRTRINQDEFESWHIMEEFETEYEKTHQSEV